VNAELGYLQKKYQNAAGEPAPRFVSRITKNTYAMVLAGGRGSRLHQLTDWRAKPAVPFGGKFRIIDFVLSNCVNSGIRRIGVATQYKSHSLIQHIQRGWSFLNGQFGEFIDLLPAQQRISEEHWYQGTADAVFQNLDILRETNPDFVLILAGDHIYKMDYGKLLAFHVESKADMTVACLEVPVEDAKAFGVMAVDEHGRVVEFAEKPSDPACIPGKPGTSLASMGIYVFNTKFLFEQLIRDADDPNSSNDFGMDIISLAGPLPARLKAVREAGFTQIMLAAQDLVGHPEGLDGARNMRLGSGWLAVTGMYPVWSSAISSVGQARTSLARVAMLRIVIPKEKS
jgi:glucose-1-phosphate adenylyltransferase